MERALDLSIENDHPVYDTLFVALAELEGVPLVTYDQKLRTKFSQLAMTPSDFLAL